MVPTNGLGAIRWKNTAIAALWTPQVHTIDIKLILFCFATKDRMVIQYKH